MEYCHNFNQQKQYSSQLSVQVFIMPIFLKKELPLIGEIGLWKISEEESYFLDRLALLDHEKKYLKSLKGKRRLEHLASRYLLHLMSGREVRGACLKDEFGKPYLEDSEYHISFSHSNEMVAVIGSPNNVGIDIQKYVDKIDRIKHKFLSEKELQYLHGEHIKEKLHILWGAKESLYKAYGRKKVEFKEHLAIEEFQWDGFSSNFTGTIYINDHQTEHDLFAMEVDDYMLVYSVQKETQ